MLTVSNRINRLPQALILVSSVLIALLSLRILVLGMDVGFPQLMHHDPDRTVVFWVHVLAGSTALLVMPWQFIKRLRLFSPLLHRCLGWIYLVAVLLAGLAGAALAPFAATNGFAGAGFLMLAAVWLATTGQAFIYAWERRIVDHQRWMVRSAALTFAAVTLRVMLTVSIPLGADFDIAYPIIAWACWVPNLLVAELYLARRRRPSGSAEVKLLNYTPVAVND